MGTVIYSASPLQALFSLFSTTALLIGLGIVGIGAAFFQKNQSRGIRAGLSLVSAFLILVGFGTGFISLRTLSSGGETVAVRLNDKHIREESCGDDGDTCTRYVLESTSGDASYDLVVTSGAYEQAQIDTCYKVSYYASRSPLAVTAETASYHRLESITRIEVADPSMCP